MPYLQILVAAEIIRTNTLRLLLSEYRAVLGFGVNDELPPRHAIEETEVHRFRFSTQVLLLLLGQSMEFLFANAGHDTCRGYVNVPILVVDTDDLWVTSHIPRNAQLSLRQVARDDDPPPRRHKGLLVHLGFLAALREVLPVGVARCRTSGHRDIQIVGRAHHTVYDELFLETQDVRLQHPFILHILGQLQRERACVEEERKMVFRTGAWFF